MSNYGQSGQWYWDFELCSWLWGVFKNLGLSDNAVGGLFANLYWESGICPYKCEGWAIPQPSLSRTISYVKTASSALDFANQYYGSGKGYSLAQWTEQSRKIAYWNYAPTSVLGTDLSAHMQRDSNFLVQELQNYGYEPSANENIWSAQGKTIWQWLTDPNVSYSDAINAVLMIYERPFETRPTYEQYSTEYNQRKLKGDKCLEDFAGIIPPPTPPTPPTPTPTSGIPIYQLFVLKNRNQNTKPEEGDYYVF